MSRNEVRRLCEGHSIDYVHDRILHEGAKRCEGKHSIYCGVPRLAKLTCVRALGGAGQESVTLRNNIYSKEHNRRVYERLLCKYYIRI